MASAAPPAWRPLPAAEFSYIGRPPETFEGRWAAIEEALLAKFAEDASFTLVDVGSNHGYFSLNPSMRFPNSQVVGIEGAVGVGNGVLGTSTRDAQELVLTEAACTHMTWQERLGLGNCFLAPEVWDMDRIEQLHRDGFRADVMLLLSVVHHIDGICKAAYAARGLDAVAGTLELLAGLFRLADAHVLELPDRPWLDHVFDQHSTPRAVIEAAVARTGEGWDLRQIYRNDWLGHRELWLIERRSACGTPPCGGDLRGFFPAVMPGAGLKLLAAKASASGRRAVNGKSAPEVVGGAPPVGDDAYARKSLIGSWRNAYGTVIDVTGSFPALRAAYSATDIREVLWVAEGGHWALETANGKFVLTAANGDAVAWQERIQGWTTQWQRVV